MKNYSIAVFALAAIIFVSALSGYFDRPQKQAAVLTSVKTRAVTITPQVIITDQPEQPCTDSPTVACGPDRPTLSTCDWEFQQCYRVVTQAWRECRAKISAPYPSAEWDREFRKCDDTWFYANQGCVRELTACILPVSSATPQN